MDATGETDGEVYDLVNEVEESKVQDLFQLRDKIDRFAAVAVGRGRDLSSRCLAQSCHWLTQQRGSIDDRYRGSCSHGLAHVSP